MSCYHPRKGFKVGETAKGKAKYKIVDFLVDHIDVVNGKPEPSNVSDISSRAEYAIRDWVMIPCGKCLGCRLDYAKQWTSRLCAEYECWPENECWFLTLTYNDEHLPYVLGADELGELVPLASLNPRDSTLFFKRLRKALDGKKIKYFLAGEYGTSTARPHMHAIIFGLPLDIEKDLVYYKRSEAGDITYTCPFLERVWKKGFVVVGKVESESISYVARYCLKKIRDRDYDFTNRVPEFTRCSNGLGLAWMNKHPEIFELASFSFESIAPGQKFMLPRYYLKKMDEMDPDLAKGIRSARLVLGRNSYENLSGGDDAVYLKKLADKEVDLKSRIRSLVRPL